MRTRSIRFGNVVIALLVAGVVFAGPASASGQFVVTNTKSETLTHGILLDSATFQYPGGICEADFESTVSEESTLLFIYPSFSNCFDTLLDRPVHVESNECFFTVHPSEGEGSTFTGSGELECPAGKSIVTRATNESKQVACTTTVGPQQIGPIHFQDLSSGVNISWNLTNLKYQNQSGVPFFGCIPKTGEYTNGSSSVSITFHAFDTEASPLDLDLVG